MGSNEVENEDIGEDNEVHQNAEQVQPRLLRSNVNDNSQVGMIKVRVRKTL